MERSLRPMKGAIVTGALLLVGACLNWMWATLATGGGGGTALMEAIAAVGTSAFRRAAVCYALAAPAAALVVWDARGPWRNPWLGWSAMAVFLLLVVGIRPVASFGRLQLFCVGLVAFAWIFPAWRRWYASGGFYTRVTAVFLLITIIVRIVPGAYAPPFFPGIGGWPGPASGKRIDQVRLYGLRLVRDDGATQWYSNGIISPMNFIHRQYNRDWSPEEWDQLLEFYFERYREAYPQLARGRTPNRRWLGILAYPGHTAYRMMDYGSFPPGRIVALEVVSESWDLSATPKVIGTVVTQRYEIRQAGP